MNDSIVRKPQKAASTRYDFERAHPKLRGKFPQKQKSKQKDLTFQRRSSESGTFFCWLKGRFTTSGEQILFQVEGSERPIEVEFTGRFKKWLQEVGYQLPQDAVWISGWPSVQMGKLVALKAKSCFQSNTEGVQEMWYFWGDIKGDEMEVPSTRLGKVFRHSIPGLTRIAPKPGRYQLELVRQGLDIIPIMVNEQQQQLPSLSTD